MLFRQYMGRYEVKPSNPELDKPWDSYKSGRKQFALHKNMHSCSFIGSEELTKLYDDRIANVLGRRSRRPASIKMSDFESQKGLGKLKDEFQKKNEQGFSEARNAYRSGSLNQVSGHSGRNRERANSALFPTIRRDDPRPVHHFSPLSVGPMYTKHHPKVHIDNPITGFSRNRSFDYTDVY